MNDVFVFIDFIFYIVSVDENCIGMLGVSRGGM